MTNSVKGIVRNLDDLGRVVIPKEMRKYLNINNKDELEIFLENKSIKIIKVEEGDVFTGEQTEDLVDFEGKKISKKTIEKLSKLLI